MTSLMFSLPFSPDRGVLAEFRGERAIRLGELLCRKLRLSQCTKGETHAPDLLVSDQYSSLADNVIRDSHFGVVVQEDKEQTIITFAPRTPLHYKNDVPNMKMVLLCLFRRAVLFHGIPFFLIHGALLQRPAGGTGIVLFGESGIGKSSAARRWEAQGGTTLSDDMTALIWIDGKLCAKPLLTWSRYPRCEIDFGAPGIAVDGMFRLGRGEGDAIVPSERSLWETALFHALMFHFHPRLFQPGSMKTIAERAFDQVDAIFHGYGPWEILGDLKGNIFHSVEQHLKTI